jgi:hypothetical protein
MMTIINPARVVVDNSYATDGMGLGADNSMVNTFLERHVRHRSYDADGKLLREKLVRADQYPVLTAAAPSGTSPAATVDLTYTAVTGATGYEIQKSTDAGVTWVPGVPPTDAASPVTQTGLEEGTIRFRIRATFAHGVSEWSNTVDVVIPAP